MKHLVLMCGIPGAGKSSYLEDNMWLSFGERKVSRDQIRFLMIKKEEGYFSREKEVFKEYVAEIQRALDDPNVFRVYADATQLTEKSRNRVLDKLKLDDVGVSVFWKNTPLEICLERNAQRQSWERVPEEQIRKMYERMQDPHNDKKYKYEEVKVI